MRDVLFLTNFSDACFRATRAVAQMVDDVDGRLTILYARDPARESKQSTVEKLYSFFPKRIIFAARDVLSRREIC